MYTTCTAIGSRMTTQSKGFAILRHIANSGGASKYDCVTNALGKIGPKRDLRGYYSYYFQMLVDNGVISPPVNGVYAITERGKRILLKVFLRSNAEL